MLNTKAKKKTLLRCIYLFATLFVVLGALALVYHIYKQKEVKFIITSEGATATTWLTNILHKFPTLNCTQYDSARPNVHNDFTNNVKIDIANTSLAEYFTLQKNHAKSGTLSIYGNVHGFILNTLLDKKPDPNIKIANIIRHPVAHIDSMNSYWLRQPQFRALIERFMFEKDNKTVNDYVASTDHYSASYQEALLYAQQLKDVYGIEPENDVATWTFLVNLGRFDRLHANMQTADRLQIPQYKFEEFTSNTEVLADLIRYVSDGKIQPTQAELITLIEIPARNVNREAKRSHQATYEAWSRTQKLAFALHLKNIGGLENNAYVRHGYDLSFVPTI